MVRSIINNTRERDADIILYDDISIDILNNFENTHYKDLYKGQARRLVFTKKRQEKAIHDIEKLKMALNKRFCQSEKSAGEWLERFDDIEFEPDIPIDSIVGHYMGNLRGSKLGAITLKTMEGETFIVPIADDSVLISPAINASKVHMGELFCIMGIFDDTSKLLIPAIIMWPHERFIFSSRSFYSNPYANVLATKALFESSLEEQARIMNYLRRISYEKKSQ